MADSSVLITAGTGPAVDTRTAPDGNHRQVVVLGDEDAANVAHVVSPTEFTGALNAGTQGPALNVNPNAIQKATYTAVLVPTSTGTLTANTPKAMLCLEHAASATKTVRIRRILMGAIQTSAIGGYDEVRITRGTAASTAGTTVTPVPLHPGTAAAEVTVKTVPTITAATTVASIMQSISGATANTGFGGAVIYDWQESGEAIPLTLRAGFLDTIVINLVSSGAKVYTTSCTVVLTEE